MSNRMFQRLGQQERFLFYLTGYLKILYCVATVLTVSCLMFYRNTLLIAISGFNLGPNSVKVFNR